MLDPPSVDEATIRTRLQRGYGISTVNLTFLPIGNDSATCVYRLDADGGQSYFLKFRAKDGFSLASLTVPNYLQEQGIPNMLAPLLSVDQTLWVDVGDCALILYDFVEGMLAADVGLSGEQWRSFGDLVRRIHSCQLPAELLSEVPRESYVPSRRQLIEVFEEAVANEVFHSSEERALAEFWNAQRDVIHETVSRSDSLANEMKHRSASRVLCHADMHTWNLLVGSDDRLWLIDWDEVILAPKERDLMFVVGGIGGDRVGTQETALFLEGYGEHTLEPTALAYYRYAWAVQDMAADGEQVFFSPGASRRARVAALKAFMNLFEPGQIIEIASRSSSRALKVKR